VSGKLVIAELEIPEAFVGRTLVETDLRRQHGLNLISVKNQQEEYGLFTPDYRFRAGDIALVSGTDEALETFAGRADREVKKGPSGRSLGRLFGIGRKRE
jgi:trk system potassium uptake protein